MNSAFAAPLVRCLRITGRNPLCMAARLIYCTSEGSAEMQYTCPVCGFPNMPYPPDRHEICPCCGTEFGYDDFARSHRELRNEWLRLAGVWFSPIVAPPGGWNPFMQVLRAGCEFDVEI